MRGFSTDRFDHAEVAIFIDAKADATGSYVDYGFHMIITNPSESVVKDEIPTLMQEGVSSCKLFVRLSDFAHRSKGLTMANADDLRLYEAARQ